MSTLTERVDRLDAQYASRFAGHPRISRDVDLLDEMLEEVEALEALPPPVDPEIKTRIEEVGTLLRGEEEKIREVRNASPFAVAADRLVQWAVVLSHRYARHFSGQSRETRDVRLLSATTLELEQLLGEMEVLAQRDPGAGLQPHIDQARSNVALYRDEQQNIRTAQQQGTPAERARRLGNLANTQFALYADHFAGKSRLSRSPQQLERIVRSLADIRDDMAELRLHGVRTQTHENNFRLVRDRVKAYKKELKTVRTMRSRAKLQERAGALASAANEVFQTYRADFAGKDRSTVDIDRLDTLIEQLYPLGRQMDDIDRIDEDDVNGRNLLLVMDTLRKYTHEWDAIREARNTETAR